jgi:hypothetical protein
MASIEKQYFGRNRLEGRGSNKKIKKKLNIYELFLMYILLFMNFMHIILPVTNQILCDTFVLMVRVGMI